MNTTINATLFHEVQEACKEINTRYLDMQLDIFHALRDTIIPEEGGMTVEEMSKITDLTPRDINSILNMWRRDKPEKMRVTKTYVLLNEDGTIDHTKRIIQTREVNYYRRKDLRD